MPAIEGRHVIAVAPAMRHVLELARRVAGLDASVLITGESGVGKEVIARRIFDLGQRRGAFVPVNCAAIPDTLAETELFGHRKGAFTGATTDKKGLAHAAEGGVLFLDEIGDMPFALQGRLLRFLDSGEIRRVGDTSVRSADVRVVAATNRPLASDARNGRFRLDLFYRLSVITLHVPPLRERVEDIGPLAQYCLARSAARLRQPMEVLSDAVIGFLEAHSWPGNVRELQNLVERATILAEGHSITLSDLKDAFHLGISPAACAEPVSPAASDELAVVLHRHHGNHGEAAAALGISRTTLWRRLKRLKPSSFGSE